MRKTLRIDDDLDHLIEVIKAKAMIDRREKITYTDALNLLLLIGLDAYPSEKRWRDVAEGIKSTRYYDEFFDELEDRIRGTDVPEDFLRLQAFLWEREAAEQWEEEGEVE